MFHELERIHDRPNPIRRFRERAGHGRRRRRPRRRRFAILKNRPREDDLTKLLGEFATDIRYRCFDHFWLVDYRLSAGPPDRHAP